MKNNPSCPDCGNVPVNHFVEKMNASIEEISSFFPKFSIRLFPARSGASFLQFLAAMRLGTIIREPDAETGGRARCIWLEAARRDITMREFRPFGIRREIFVAKIPQTPHIIKTIIFNGLPRPAQTLSGKNGLPASLAWVDNKPVVKKKLAESGIPVARGDTAFTWKKTKEIFGKLKKPVIVKPSTGSRSRHTTTHIYDESGLRTAYVRAKRLSPRVIVEEQLAGHVYRGTVIGGKVAGIRRKDPPQVTGDGVHSVRELIDIENRRPERQGPIYAKIDVKNKNFRLEKNIYLEAIPPKDSIVVLSPKTSIGLGGGSTDVTDIAHRDIISLLRKIAVVLDDQLVGADFIVSDITRPLSEQPRSGVIECNSLPFIDAHLFPLEGTPRDTAAALWDVI